MKSIYSIALMFSLGMPLLLQATEWECGRFKAFENSRQNTLPRMVYFTKNVTLDDGEVVEFQAPMIAVNEKTTDYIAPLVGQEKICIKSNHTYGSQLQYFVFDIKPDIAP